jgi:SNF2 family DNA or RNA helicase
MAASYVHIVEPHFNPMVEAQAAARVHRIGQQREVHIYHYIVKDSVEEVTDNS